MLEYFWVDCVGFDVCVVDVEYGFCVEDVGCGGCYGDVGYFWGVGWGEGGVFWGVRCFWEGDEFIVFFWYGMCCLVVMLSVWSWSVRGIIWFDLVNINVVLRSVWCIGK